MKATILIYFMIWSIIETMGTNANYDPGHFLRTIMAKLHHERSINKYPFYYIHRQKFRRRTSPNEPVTNSHNEMSKFPEGNIMYDIQTQMTVDKLQGDKGEHFMDENWETSDTTTSQYDLNSQMFHFYQALPQYNFSHLQFEGLKSTNESKQFLPTAPASSSIPFEDSLTVRPTQVFNNSVPVINLFHPQDLANQIYSPILVGNHVAVTPPESQFLYSNLGTMQINSLPQGFWPTYNINESPAMNNFVDDTLIDNMLNAMRPFETPSELNQYENPSSIAENQLNKLSKDPLLLFMASFVSAAIIFMGAIIFLPKVITISPEGNRFKVGHELATLTKLAVQVMKGDHCSERLACEVGRAMETLQFSSQPIRILEAIVPENIAEQLAQVRKALNSKQVCKFIRCKLISPTGNKVAVRTLTEEQQLKIADKPLLKLLTKKKPGKPGKTLKVI